MLENNCVYFSQTRIKDRGSYYGQLIETNQRSVTSVERYYNRPPWPPFPTIVGSQPPLKI